MIELHRKQRGLTQQELAKAANVSLRSYQRLISGDGGVAIETLERVLAALGLKMEFVAVERPTLDELAKVYGHEDE